MFYRFIHLFVYTISVLFAMYGLSCFKFDHFLRKGMVSRFYVFYMMISICLGYLFAQFILNFGTWTMFWT
ncbi:MAG: DUF1146 domain-containing protein [bacterium]